MDFNEWTLQEGDKGRLSCKVHYLSVSASFAAHYRPSFGAGENHVARRHLLFVQHLLQYGHLHA